MSSLSSIASVLANSKGFAFSIPLRSVSDFEQPGYFSWAGQWFQANRWQSRLLIVTPSLVDAPRTPLAQKPMCLITSGSGYGVLIRKRGDIYKYEAMEQPTFVNSSWYFVGDVKDIDRIFSDSVIKECKGPYDDEAKSSS